METILEIFRASEIKDQENWDVWKEKARNL